MRNRSNIVLLWIFSAAVMNGSRHGGAPLLQPDEGPQVSEQECACFGKRHDTHKLVCAVHDQDNAPESAYSAMTEAVTRQLGFVALRARIKAAQNTDQSGAIDHYLFSAMADAGVTPADTTTDAEFLRRVTLDLTGRIPTPDRALSFLSDPSPDKRAKLIDELLAKPEWVDKWAMFFGDLFKNNSSNTQIRRFDQGRDAFYKWIHDSLAANKPYDQMARELISAQGANSFQQGELNWMAGGVVTGGPIQDIWDQQAVNISQTFLGIAHMNCLLCHNGRGHLDSLSLWGSQGTRYQAWQFASFLSHSYTSRTPVPGSRNVYYWSVEDDTPRARIDYPLNTTTGNRPARQPVGTEKNVAPVYWFSGQGPNAGEDYRVALAREITSDFQFARAAVNYIWKAFFVRGIVDPPDQFDPARLDPGNPPPAPWTLQPSNARLLNALAQDFVDSGYDLKALMREIANSQAYQLSARYEGWNPAWEPLFARKLVRRLWAEEIHDAIAQSSNIIPSYNIPDYGPSNWAMKFPETRDMPAAGNPVTAFLDAFLRGNRDDEERRDDGSISQALGLMNDKFVDDRIKAVGSGASASLLARTLNLPDDQLVTNLFLAVLSRFPSDAEKKTAIEALANGNRTQAAQNLLWSLYNKVDFIFNY